MTDLAEIFARLSPRSLYISVQLRSRNIVLYPLVMSDRIEAADNEKSLGLMLA